MRSAVEPSAPRKHADADGDRLPQPDCRAAYLASDPTNTCLRIATHGMCCKSNVYTEMIRSSTFAAIPLAAVTLSMVSHELSRWHGRDFDTRIQDVSTPQTYRKSTQEFARVFARNKVLTGVCNGTARPLPFVSHSPEWKTKIFQKMVVNEIVQLELLMEIYGDKAICDCITAGKEQCP